MQEILKIQFLNNKVGMYALSLIIFLAVIIAIKILKFLAIKSLNKIAKKTKNDFDDLIVAVTQKISGLTFTVIALYFALLSLNKPIYITKGIYYALIIAVVYEIIKALLALVDYAVGKIVVKRAKREADGHIIKVFGIIIKALIWLGAIIIILQNLGINVSSLVAGLGIGGIAIALAVQNILGDLFSAFSLYMDKPFEIGDFIVVGEKMGVVKKIGIKTTRLTALQGEEIVISNQDLTGSRVQNFKKMRKRRIQFAFGVLYETSKEKLEEIPDIVKRILDEIKLAEFDRAHFKDYGDFSLNFEVVYYVLTGDYNEYMDTQQTINLEIFGVFKEKGIEFAYPTQTLYLNKIKE